MLKISAFYLEKQKSFVYKKSAASLFRKKTFLFVKMEILNFQYLYDLGFQETRKISAFYLYKQKSFVPTA